MISSVGLPASYRVEVSGWDTEHNFFVTKADLQWYDDNGKQLVLSLPISNRAILFVRLLHSTDSDRALPVPYQAEILESTANGRHKFRLHPIRPRTDSDFSRLKRNKGV